jgi:hypothetical protein
VMISTTVSQFELPLTHRAFDADGAALLEQYETLLKTDAVRWAAEYRKIRILGKGGQGVVYLSERQGTDLFQLPVALKLLASIKSAWSRQTRATSSARRCTSSRPNTSRTIR